MTCIAYVVSQYPAPSHTFIRREIAALRRQGLNLLPFSVRPGLSSEDEDVPSIIGRSWPDLLRLAVGAAIAAPTRSFRTWALAQRHRPAGARGWVWAQLHFIEALVLAAILRRAGADRVHSHFANSGATVAMLAAWHLQLPWSLTLHGISETDPPAGDLLAEKIGHAEFVACASWFMRAQGMRLVTAELWPKFHIVRCGVELGRIGPPTASGPSERLRFVTVGRISAEKGYPGLIEAFGALIARGIDAELAIVGDGPLRQAIELQLARAGLGNRVTMLGALAEFDTLGVIATADVFVLPSLMEGLPVVLMEAMALGKPVIAASVAGIPELIQDSMTGLLFRPGDWENLSRCMDRLAVDAELRHGLASAARNCIEQEYDIDRAVRPLAVLFGAPEA